MSEADEKDLLYLQRIEKTIKMVLERSKNHGLVIADSILNETKAPSETIRAAIRLHYIRKISRHHYESTLSEWQPIHYRNILSNVRSVNAKYNDTHAKKKKRQMKSVELPSISEKEFNPDYKEMETATTNYVKVLRAVKTLQELGCTGTINVVINI